MYVEAKSSGFTRKVISKLTLLVFGAATILLPVLGALGQSGSETGSSIPQLSPPEPDAHMSETLRSSVNKIVVVAGESPANEEISGSYEKSTPGLVGGMNEGSRLGTISPEIGGVNVAIPIPILTIPGAIYGGLSGAAKREIQEFRDALTDELANAESKPLSNDGLALDVNRELAKLQALETRLFAPTVPIPDDMDAVLYVSFNDVGIDVQGSEAVITVAAKATLRRVSDGNKLYETVAYYQDRDTLGNWTENENALWRDYANFAAHYLAREISTRVFDGVKLEHELRPTDSGTAKRDRKDERQYVSKKLRPTLAWDLTLDGDDSSVSWVGTIDESDIFYDVELYTNHRLVYVEKSVPDSGHTVAMDLEACKTYRWSVRPSFHVDGDVRFGEWMRFETETDDDAPAVIGIVGRNASLAPGYIQDFALLKIKCGSK